jgi:mono/diheme cytochrome c family protein
VAGCDLPGKPKPEDRYLPPQEIKAFGTLFQQNCVACHGPDGKLGPAPPLNDRLFLALVSDTELERVITEGRHGTLMPAFAKAQGGGLTAEQVRILAGGIKERWGPVEPAPKEAPPYLVAQAKPDGTGTGNKEEGAKAFSRACASCHGSHGQGGGSKGHGDHAEAGAIHDRDFLALISDQALRRLVITGRPDLGMPDYADPHGRPEGFKPLSSQEVADIVALLASWRQGGSVEMKGN